MITTLINDKDCRIMHDIFNICDGNFIEAFAMAQKVLKTDFSTKHALALGYIAGYNDSIIENVLPLHNLKTRSN